MVSRKPLNIFAEFSEWGTRHKALQGRSARNSILNYVTKQKCLLLKITIAKGGEIGLKEVRA